MLVEHSGRWVVLVVLLWPGAEDAWAICLGPTCCQSYIGDSATAIAQGEVVEFEPGHAVIQLLAGTIYCAGGVECSPADFPVDFTWGDQVCPESCPECAELAVGDRGLFGVDLGTGCLERFLEVSVDGVECNRFEPVAFVLEQYLSPTCIDATSDEGYWDCKDTFESCAACAQAGQADGIVLAMVVGLEMVRARRSKRVHG